LPYSISSEHHPVYTIFIKFKVKNKGSNNQAQIMQNISTQIMLVQSWFHAIIALNNITSSCTNCPLQYMTHMNITEKEGLVPSQFWDSHVLLQVCHVGKPPTHPPSTIKLWVLNHSHSR
jgi:hypothetical protein